MQFATFIQVAVLLFRVSFAFRVKSFADFLDFNHLKHGIIVMCNDGTFPREELLAISKKNLWLSYFNIDHARSDESRAEFGKLFYYGAPKVGVSLDLSCQSEANSILEYASSGNFFNSSQAWLVLANSTETGMKAFEVIEINIDADVTLGVRVEGENSLRLYDLYKVCHQCGTPLHREIKGNWSANGGMRVEPHFWQSTVQRRRNFSDITINGGIVIVDAPKGIPVLEHIKGFNNKHLDSMQRKTYNILIILEDIYNFRFNLVISDSWGIEEHGNWTGVMGDLLAGNVAISLSPLRFTRQRVLAAHYLPEVHAEIIRFLFRHPKRSSIRNIFLQPFNSTVWYAVLSIITIGSLLLAITMRQESKRFIRMICSENNFVFFTLIILESIFLQGPSQMFHCVSTRMLIISICIFAVMLYQFYSAYIVGSLLADVRRTIVNMPALFNSSLDVGMEDIAYNYEFFINTTNQMAKDIYVHRIMKNPRTNILPLEKGLERIGRGGFAYHVAVVRAYHTLKDRLTQLELCDLQEVAMENPFLSCPVVPNGSPFKEHFATAILKFREIGLMTYHDKLWSVEKPQCSQEILDKNTTVDIGDFLPAIGFLAVAMLMSCLVLGVEIIKRHWLDALKRRRPEGRQIIDAPNDIPVIEYIESFDNKHLDAEQRKVYHILKLMEDIYNFRIKAIITDSWGVQQHEGNWTGLMGNLLNGNIAISLTPLRFTQKRVKYVRYLSEVHVEIIRFLFRHPRRSPIRNIFLEPFTATVWYTVLALIAAGVLLMAITMRYEFAYVGVDGCVEKKLDFFTLVILEAIFLQGPSQMFQLVSSRTLIISICIFAVMLNQFYSAFIVGMLLADAPRTIINMPALFNSSLDIGMEDITYNYEFFINTSNQMAKDIYVHRIMRNLRTNILPLEEGLERIGRGGFAYHVALVRAYRTLQDRLTQSEFCDLQEVEMEVPLVCCPAVPHGSPYKEHFASAILQIRETGLMTYHDKAWSVEKPQCTPDMIEKDTTVDMEHFIPAMGFLAVAILTSSLICAIELLTHHLCKTSIRSRLHPLNGR